MLQTWHGLHRLWTHHRRAAVILGNNVATLMTLIHMVDTNRQIIPHVSVLSRLLYLPPILLHLACILLHLPCILFSLPDIKLSLPCVLSKRIKIDQRNQFFLEVIGLLNFMNDSLVLLLKII